MKGVIFEKNGIIFFSWKNGMSMQQEKNLTAKNEK